MKIITDMKKVLALTLVLLGLLSCKTTKHTKGVYNDQTVDIVDTIPISRDFIDTIQTGLSHLSHIPVAIRCSKSCAKFFSDDILLPRLSKFNVSVFDVRGFKKRSSVHPKTNKKDSLIWPTSDKEVLGWATRQPFKKDEFIVVFQELFEMYMAGDTIFLEDGNVNVFHIKGSDGKTVALDLWYKENKWFIHVRPFNSVWLYGGRIFMRRKFDR